MKNNSIYIISALAFSFYCTLFLTSCSDDDEMPPSSSTGTLLELSEEKVSLSTKEQYRSIQVIKKKSGLSLSIGCDAEWIKMQADTIAWDGYFEFLVEADADGVERSTYLRFTATDGTMTETVECEIIQGEDSGSNYEEPATKTMRVGYGYNIFGPFQRDVSVMSPIISQNYLNKVNDALHLVETNPRSELKTEKVTARSLMEMGQLLTQMEEKSKSGIVSGASKTVNIHSTSNYEGADNQYAYIRLLKTVAMRSLDIGVMSMLLNKGEPLFTPEFEKMRKKVIESPTVDNINTLLNQFGTHLVVQAELGASIELSVNFSHHMKGSLEMRTEDFADYFFRGESSSFLLPDNKIEGMTNNMTIDKTCIVTGGSATAKTNLETEIAQKGIPSQTVLKAWLDSSSGDITTDAVAATLVPVNFKLIPIWYLFPTECVGVIIRAVNERAQRSDSQIADNKLGTDYYKIELTDDLLKFGEKTEDTQVKVLYAQNGNSSILTPTLEICYEYVPQIRGDKRIPIVYGIRNGSPYIGAGFFPGDGNGNPPAWLTFSDGEAFVLPVEGADAKQQIRTLYYLHGNIYEKNYGIDVSTPQSMRLVEQYFKLTKQYPIVKIGEGYWIRKNIEEDMYFGEPIDPSYEYSEYELREAYFEDRNMLYACIFYGNSPELTSYYGDMYGSDMNEIYGKRTKWFLPMKQDIYNLETYVGDNPRILLKKQVSGFEAQFEGVYGIWDDLGNQPFSSFSLHYQGEYCFIPCKDENNVSNGIALILSKDYRLSLSTIEKAQENNYPVRLYRTAYWVYPNINK